MTNLMKMKFRDLRRFRFTHTECVLIVVEIFVDFLPIFAVIVVFVVENDRMATF